MKKILFSLLLSLMLTAAVYAAPGLCHWKTAAGSKNAFCSPGYSMCKKVAETYGVSIPSYTIPDRCSDGGWYVFKNSTNRDRDTELRGYVGEFGEITATGNFHTLCGAISKTCNIVIDWEGKFKECDENPNDGSRVAYCA